MSAQWPAILLQAVLLGVALAMDAFSVSIANALHEPKMRESRKIAIAGTFAFFQFLMPMIGWICVREILDLFTSFQKFIPWIALILLAWIGGKMIAEGVEKERAGQGKTGKDNAAEGRVEEQQKIAGKNTAMILFWQGIATSIDALSTGFAFADYTPWQALISALIIAAETYLICRVGIRIGRRLGRPESGKTSILGGVILVLIGIEIFIKGIR